MSDEAALYWDKLIRQFGRKAGESRYISLDLLRGPAEWVVLGAEYQPPTSNYCWNGLKRRTALQRRWCAFQWTIEGEGILQVGNQVYPQTPGNAFLVQIPSDHEYRISKTGPGWKFMFIRIDDPWITDRVCDAAKKINWQFPVKSSDRLAAETLHFFEKAYAGALQDPFETDRMTMAWMIELRRHIHQQLHPHDARMEMLGVALAFYDQNKKRSFGVEDFAAHIGMTRSRASVHFQKLTGHTLAAYFLELKLRDAIELLRDGHKLEYIARETGFADANHLCKSFKRVYHTTPGEFRRKR